MEIKIGEILARIASGRATADDAQALAEWETATHEVMAMLEAEIAALRAAMPVWRSVEQEPPQVLTDVLVVWDDANGPTTVDIAFMRPNGDWIVTGSEPFIYIRPVAWMPAPLTLHPYRPLTTEEVARALPRYLQRQSA